MKEEIKVVLSGYGKVGPHVLRAAVKDPEVQVVKVIEKQDHPLVDTKQEGVWLSQDLKWIEGIQVLIEFSTPAAVMEHSAIAAKFKVPMLIATTGLTNDQKSELQQRASEIPIVLASNVTLGMNILFTLIPKIAEVLYGAGWTSRIIEAHREGKKDAPSGSAQTLGQGILEKTGQEPVYFSIRAGDVVGEHRVIFYSQGGETLEIIHRVQSRDDFGLAAIALAKMIPKLEPGFYSGADLIVRELD